jgi:hypothetical protein|tara:strand:- start:704 stop:913 length:210 start_codon:yes stop_codon:yes gene_type:complete
MKMLNPRKRTLNELRQNKTFGYRAPNYVKDFAPDAPGEMGDLAARLKRIDEKLDSIDGKLEFLLKYLEL